MFRYAAIVSTLMVGAVPTLAHANAMSGVWDRGDGKATVRIEKCGANTCAINVWIKPGTKNEKVGDKLIMDLEEVSDGSFEGKAEDPQRGLSYNISVNVDGDKMTTRGCVLGKILCKKVGWTKQ